MKDNVDAIKQQIDTAPLNYNGSATLLDMIYWCYVENNRIDNDTIKQLYERLRQQIHIPEKEYDHVLYTIGDLNLEHARLAFHAGLQFGFRLMHEVSETQQ